MTLRLCFLVLSCWLLRSAPARAQPWSKWPRDPVSGRIVFKGVLPWPMARATPAQQRAWARRWYAANLTTEPLPPPGTSNTTFGGLRNWARLDSVFYPSAVPSGEDSASYRVIWRLVFRVNLTPTPTGLAYRLSEFECVELVFDASTSSPLEKALGQFAPQLAVYQRRLRSVLAHL